MSDIAGLMAMNVVATAFYVFSGAIDNSTHKNLSSHVYDSCVPFVVSIRVPAAINLFEPSFLSVPLPCGNGLRVGLLGRLLLPIFNFVNQLFSICRIGYGKEIKL